MQGNSLVSLIFEVDVDFISFVVQFAFDISASHLPEAGSLRGAVHLLFEAQSFIKMLADLLVGHLLSWDVKIWN